MQNFDISSKVVVSGGIFPWLIYEAVCLIPPLSIEGPGTMGVTQSVAQVRLHSAAARLIVIDSCVVLLPLSIARHVCVFML